MLVSLLLQVVLATATVALTKVNRSIQSQRPLIARTMQQYKWSLSPQTFTTSNSNAVLMLSTSPLPQWLSFEPSTLTFSGMPTQFDSGTTTIKVTASSSNGDKDVSDNFKLYVTPSPPPVLNIPIAKQLRKNNPSISSTFLLHPGSSFNSGSVPTLRVPPAWSFSIGLQGATFLPDKNGPGGDVYMSAGLANGSDLPEWVKFSNKSITFDGMAPAELPLQVLDIVLYGSDRYSFGAIQDHFNLIVAPHELYQASPLPKQNIVANNKFSFVLDDFDGIFLDESPIDSQDLTSVVVDCSLYSQWLTFDQVSRRLEGVPPPSLPSDTDIILPIQLTHSSNMSLTTNFTLGIIPSIFAAEELTPLLAHPGMKIEVSPFEYFSNKQKHDQVDISVTFDRSEAMQWLVWSNASNILSGVVPADLNYSHVSVTFSARSNSTRTTSRATLLISLSGTPPSTSRDNGSQNDDGSNRTRLVLAATLGTLGGVIALCLMLAACRKWCSARETDGRQRSAYVIDHEGELKDKNDYDSLEKLQGGEDNGGQFSIVYIGGRENQSADPAIVASLPHARSTSPTSSLGSAANTAFNAATNLLHKMLPVTRPRKRPGPISKPKPLIPLSKPTMARDETGDSLFYGNIRANGRPAQAQSSTASARASTFAVISSGNSPKQLTRSPGDESDDVTLGGSSEGGGSKEKEVTSGDYDLDDDDRTSANEGRGSPDSEGRESPERPQRRADFKAPGAPVGIGLGKPTLFHDPFDATNSQEMSSSASSTSLLNAARSDGEPRLVQFKNERKADGSGNGAGGMFAKALEGNRQVSHRVVLAETPPALPDAYVAPSSSGRRHAASKLPPGQTRGNIVGGGQDRIQLANLPYTLDLMVTDEDPRLSLGLHYVRSFGGLGSEDHSDTSAIFFSTPVPAAPPSNGPSSSSGVVLPRTSSNESAGKTRVLTPPLKLNPKQRSKLSSSPKNTYSPPTSNTSARSLSGRNFSGHGAAEDDSLSQVGQEFGSGFGFSSSQDSSSTTRSGSPQEQRIIVGVNEPFNFSAPLSSRVFASIQGKLLTAMLENGSALPPWLNLDERDFEFWGVPDQTDKGVARVRLFAEEDEIGTFVIEVVGRG